MNAPFPTSALMAPRMMADFEARSRVDLTEVGAWRYSEDESTQIMCLAYAFGDGEIKLWTPWVEEDVECFYEEKVTTGRGKNKVVTMERRSCIERQMVYRPELCPFPQEIIDFILAGGTIEAHSAQMERSLWLNQLHKKFAVPMCTRWVDTQASCAYRALPLSLDEVGTVLNLDVQKDKEGKTLIKLLCQPQKITKKMKIKQEWNNDPALFYKFFDYCKRDIGAERSLGNAVGDLPPSEYRLWVLDQNINYRGVRLDFDAVYAAKAVVEKAKVNMEAELVAMTNGEITTGNQRDRIVEWLRKQHKVIMPNMQSGTLKETLKDKDLPAEAKRMLQIRQELSRTSTEKIYTMIACVCSNGRIRGLLQYHGAGTGRWAGRLVQPQNFPRPKINGKPFKGKIDDLISIIMFEDPDVIRLCFGPEMEALAASLRGMFIAEEGHDFLTSDFASIEARIVLWLAGQMDAMEIFEKADRKEGPDIYCHLAGQIYGRVIDKDKDPDERQLGKIGVLGCGYQMGPGKLQEQAHDDYELDLPIETCETIVKTYRNTFPMVKEFWRDINNTACSAITLDRAVEHRGIVYEPITDAAGKWLACRLPSGRRIWYFNPHVTMEGVSDETAKKYPNMAGKKFPKLWYEARDNKRGGMWSVVSTYGGMLTENIVQAIARDIMAEAMLRAEAAGYKIILTVHDEIVSEVLKDFGSQKEFDALMAQKPRWCQNMPIAVEGWRGPRYRK